MCSNSPSLRVTFHRELAAEEYAAAVLACQLGLMMVGLSDLSTVWSDGTATDEQINALSDRWQAGSPWSG